MKIAFATPFDLQVEFLKRKLDLPTATWRDIWQSAHDRSFVVAGAVKADLLADLHGAVTKAAAEGRGIADFRKDFWQIVEARGWHGWTGEGTKGGEAWRTRVIYQTNLSTSHAAGRWAQINDPALANFRPYIKYHHADGVANPRPHHLAWHGLVLPKDHPFWQTHAVPNGWSCFPGETPVQGKFRRGLKARYAGKVVKIVTGKGHRLTLTVNHPVLTLRGWVRADELRKGDDVFCRARGDGGIAVGENEERELPSAKQIFDTLSSHSIAAQAVSAEDFYGDGKSMQGNIYVAGADGLLARDFDTARLQGGGERLFVWAQPTAVALMRSGNAHASAHGLPPALLVDPDLGRLRLPADLPVGADAPQYRELTYTEFGGDGGGANAAGVHAGDLRPQGWISVAASRRIPGSTENGFSSARRPLDLSPALPPGVAAAAQGLAMLDDDPAKRLAAASGLAGELKEAFAIAVTGDEVIGVTEDDFCGHVYDFQTDDGLIMASGIVVSNCGCWLTSAGEKDYQAAKQSGKTEPPEGWDAIDPKTGAPVGIDKGWAYAPGASTMQEMQRFALAKAAALPPEIGRAFAAEVAGVLAADNAGVRGVIDYATRARDTDGKTRHLPLGPVVSHARIAAATGKDLAGFVHVLDAAKLRHVFDAHGNPVKEAAQGQRAVVEADIARLAEVVDAHDAVTLSALLANGGLSVLEFVKRFGGDEFHYRAEIRPGKRRLAPATLFIKVI